MEVEYTTYQTSEQKGAKKYPTPISNKKKGGINYIVHMTKQKQNPPNRNRRRPGLYFIISMRVTYVRQSAKEVTAVILYHVASCPHIRTVPQRR